MNLNRNHEACVAPVLRVGQLWRSSGPPADASVVSEGPVGLGAWGDGLVDRSLASLWYPGDWNEVGDDELVFLLPTLSAWRPDAAAQDPDGPGRYLARALTTRALTASARISSNSDARPATAPRQVLELLVNREILTSLTLEEILATPAGAGRVPRFPVASRSEDVSLPAWLAFELTALAHLDRLVLDARGTAPANGASPLVDWPLSLADVVLASIHARLNGVYVHPELAHAQELLTAAALLGHLANGRAAYLPPPIAQSLVDLLSGGKTTGFGEDDGCARIVRMHADLAGGAEYVRWLARRAATSGRPLLAKPRPPLMPSDTGSTTWNARLLQRIAQRWHVSA